MKIEQLSLINYRGFEHLDIDLETDITVIAGVNGVGKSSVLNALAVLLSRTLVEFTPTQARPSNFAEDDIQHDHSTLGASLRLLVDAQTFNAGILRARESESDRFVFLRQELIPVGVELQSFAEQWSRLILTGDAIEGMQETRTALREMKQYPQPPIAVYFSPRRQLPGRPRALPVPKPFDPSDAYRGALIGEDVDLREFMHWFHTQDTLDTEEGAPREAVLNSLRTVVNELVPEFTNLRIEQEPRLGLVVDKEGKPLYLHQLSDGERGLLAVVFDLTRRLAIANPESENPIRDGVALVLLDEVELHLHPKWQRDVLRKLKLIFAACQFVVTTHSPLVLGEVEARCIRFLKWDRGKVAVTVPQEALGLDANRILLELMEASARNEAIEEELEELFVWIDDEQFDKAREAMKRLREKLGERDPELTRANTLLEFLEGEE